MMRRSLLEHARRQWRITRKLIARHQMIARTDVGAYLLRNIDVRAAQSRYVVSNTGIVPGVTTTAIDWSAAAHLAPFTRQEFVSPAVQLPDEAIGDTSVAVEPLEQPIPATLPAPPTAPKVDPLVELVRRVREQALLEQAAQLPPTVTSQDADPQVEAVQQTHSQANPPFAAPTLPSVPQTISTPSAASVVSPASQTPAASATRKVDPSLAQRRQPMGRRVVEVPLANQASEPTQLSRVVALPTPDSAPVPVAHPEVLQALPQASAAPETLEAHTSVKAGNPDVATEDATLSSPTWPVDETANTLPNDRHTPREPDAAPPEWVDRLAHAPLPRVIGPTISVPPAQIDPDQSSPALFEEAVPQQTAQTLPQAEQTLVEPDTASAELPLVATPRSVMPASEVESLPTRRDATPPVAAIPVQSNTNPTILSAPPDAPASLRSAQVLPPSITRPSSTAVASEPSVTPANLPPAEPPRAVVQAQSTSATASALPGETILPVAHPIFDAEATATVTETIQPPSTIPAPKAMPQLHTADEFAPEVAISSEASPGDLPSAPGETSLLTTGRSPQAWAARLMQVTAPPEPVAKLPSENVPAPVASRSTTLLSTKSPESSAQPAQPVAPEMEITAADASVSTPSAPDRSPEAWAARMAQTVRPPVSRQPSPTQADAPARPGGAMPPQTRSLRPVEPDRSAQTPVPVATRALPIQDAQRLDASAAPVTASTEPIDRSPTGWAARLFPTARPPEQHTAQTPPVSTPVSAPTAPVVAPAHTPVPESTRRFLRPLVGIDPNSVRVHASPLADQIATSHRADALTAGEDVLLANGNAGDSPEALGLLAHELTHVARNREARFVPPMIAKARLATIDEESDEETLAQTVEQRVTQAARTRQARPHGMQPTGLPFDAPRSSSDADGTQEHAAITTTEDQGTWGGLPAPWDPLPTWLTASAPVSYTTPASTLVPSSVTVAAPSVPVASANTNGAAPAVQLAAINRAVTSETISATPPAPQAAPQKAAEPNLDALARQVYSILKQRLAAERRRQG